MNEVSQRSFVILDGLNRVWLIALPYEKVGNAMRGQHQISLCADGKVINTAGRVVTDDTARSTVQSPQ